MGMFTGLWPHDARCANRRVRLQCRHKRSRCYLQSLAMHMKDLGSITTVESAVEWPTQLVFSSVRRAAEWFGLLEKSQALVHLHTPYLANGVWQ